MEQVSLVRTQDPQPKKRMSAVKQGCLSRLVIEILWFNSILRLQIIMTVWCSWCAHCPEDAVVFVRFKGPSPYP